MTLETKYPTKIVKGVEVLVVPSGVDWTSCSLCPFNINDECALAKDDDYCGFGTYYVGLQEFAIVRLQGKV